MFYIDFWGFTNDSLYFGYNSTKHKFSILCIFIFHGAKRSQLDLDFFQKLSLREDTKGKEG
jgi:hypothetical protein